MDTLRSRANWENRRFLVRSGSKSAMARLQRLTYFEHSTSRKGFNGVPFSNYFLTTVHNVMNRANPGDCPYEQSVPVRMGRDLSKEEIVKVGLPWTSEYLCWYLNEEMVRRAKRNGESKNSRMSCDVRPRVSVFVG